MIKILCIGKIKESFYQDAIKEYMKRLSKYHKVIIEELPDSNKQKEEELLLKKINQKDYNIVLDIEGKMLNSIELSNHIDKTFQINSNITFIIGGSDGLTEKVKEIADFKLSFSKLTFPHQLFRVILLEQIYRSFKILNHETYHK
ncbi:MAG: 23S rRNA (pseudouridine(1915)-N(3))-methyltransferase RlmH [Bacilli bacterium]|nr:23S rRNA (pseudouridine(1915)-N(3))-methyltransferase RlmH [Bacilli bacterium]